MNLCKLNTEKMLGEKAEPIIKKHYAEMSEIIEKLPEDDKNDQDTINNPE